MGPKETPPLLLQVLGGKLLILDTYNITKASLGLQTNDVRHYVPFVNKAVRSPRLFSPSLPFVCAVRG